MKLELTTLPYTKYASCVPQIPGIYFEVCDRLCRLYGLVPGKNVLDHADYTAPIWHELENLTRRPRCNSGESRRGRVGMSTRPHPERISCGGDSHPGRNLSPGSVGLSLH